MDRIVDRPGALDVHKASVTACVRVWEGRELTEHLAEFQTTVHGLLALRRPARLLSYAAVWQPAEACLCLSHRIWLGSAAHPRLRRQYDVAGLPEIIQAQGRHTRLARRRGRQTAITAIAEASRITALWARHGFYRTRRIPLIRELRGEVPITGKLPPSDNVTAVVTYPETVDLARILAMPRWRSPAAATAGDLQQFEREVRSRTGIEYVGVDSRYDPLFRWFQKHHEASCPAGRGEFMGQGFVHLPEL